MDDSGAAAAGGGAAVGSRRESVVAYSCKPFKAAGLDEGR